MIICNHLFSTAEPRFLNFVYDLLHIPRNLTCFHRRSGKWVKFQFPLSCARVLSNTTCFKRFVFFFLKHNAMNYYILLNDRSLTFLSRKNIKDSKHMHLHIWRYSILHAKFCSTLLFYQIYYENRSDCSICREKKIVSCYRQNFLSCLKSSCRATIQVSSYGELPQDAMDRL